VSSRAKLVTALGAVALLIVFAVWLLVSNNADDRGHANAQPSTPSVSTSATESPSVSPTDVAPPTLSPSTPTPSPATTTPATPAATTAPPVLTPLSLDCAKPYPHVVFVTDTGTTQASVCATTAVGDVLRVVVKRGGVTFDVAGTYVWKQDAFRATHDGVTYLISGVDGSVTLTDAHGTKTRETSDDYGDPNVEADDF
jgi:cytoskeletal protein RodZ